ncbi:DNA polymerase I [hydrothermal vent metagenome]|uniref:DNA-directed DNA polymerase n=1 Tax=hydrothermal vent metagenome TaxID=652676 RepID=A0A3B0ZC02_9ZZZZ
MATKKSDTKQTAPFILVDGSSYLFRAYHAMPDSFKNSKGEATGVIYGVTNMIRKLLADYAPSHIAVVFDAKGKTFRHKMYKEYKANRPPMPDDLREQIQPVHSIVEAMGLPLICISGVEADDVIGTLAQQASELGMETLISTGDKDMAQLVNQHVSLINTMTDTFSDVGGVKEKFGVAPEQIIDYLALMGDKADNIPGVPKVGPKTAAKWLDSYGSIDSIIKHADEIKGKVGESLRENLQQLPLSKELTTIKCDVDLDCTPKTLVHAEPDIESLRELFSRYEFKSWLAQLDENNGNSQTAKDKTSQKAEVKTQYDKVLTEKQLNAWLKKLNAAEVFAFDLETTSLNYMQAEIVGLSFAVEANKAAYVPLAHCYEAAPQQLDRDKVLALFKPLLEDKNTAKLGQNLKYDMSVLANYDINMQGIAFDTMLESYVLNSVASRHDMDTLALRHLDKHTIHFEDIAGKGAKKITFDYVDIDKATEYAAEDADITLQLHQTLWPQLQAVEPLENVFITLEMPLLSVLSRMERRGVLLDTKALATQSAQLSQRITELEEQVYTLAGEEFNLGSPKQLQKILFEKLELPIISKTPKGQPSTAESVLVELAHDYELPKLLLEYRSLAKLKSTYTDKLPKMMDATTGRVHTSYHQAVAATGRLSSTEPNLQNIPVRTEEGRRIRKAFITRPGYKMLAADYSQIELRIMAHLSEDKGLLHAFEKGIDVHSATAAEVFGIEVDAVSKEQRRRAKAINFGLIYGMSAFGLAKQLDIERHQAQSYVDLYFERYPSVKDYMERTRKVASEQGYVETVLGRRLYLPDINARNAMRRQYAERTAINAPMQGTAADIIKLAMIKIDQQLENSTLDCAMLMQVHDELVFEVKEKDLDAAEKMINKAMVEAVSLNVSLVVDVGIGNNWDEAH